MGNKIFNWWNGQHKVPTSIRLKIFGQSWKDGSGSSSDLNHSSKFAIIVVVAFRKKRSETWTQPSSGYCSVRKRITLILSKSTKSCVLISASAMSTSNFEYEYYEYNFKISMNAYKYQKALLISAETFLAKKILIRAKFQNCHWFWNK